MRKFLDGKPRRRLRPWVARTIHTLLGLIFGLGMGYAAWGAGGDWSEMPDHGSYSTNAGLVMYIQGCDCSYEQPFGDLPSWEPWNVHRIPIVGRFNPNG